MPLSQIPRSKAAAKANYDRLSRWYDWLAFSERKYRNLGLAKLHVTAGEQVLEVGVGTGHALLWLAKAVGENGRVAGLDLSPKMVQRTKARLQHAGLLKRATLHEGDAAQMPFASSTFDALFLSFTLELFDTPEIPQVLAHCRRVLRKNGRLCVVSLEKVNQPGRMVRLYEWLHDKLPTLVDCRPIFGEQLVQHAGFEITAVSRLSMWGLPVAVVCAQKAPDQ